MSPSFDPWANSSRVRSPTHQDARIVECIKRQSVLLRKLLFSGDARRGKSLRASFLPRLLAARSEGSGLRVQGLGFRVQGSGFRVQGSGFRV